MKQFFKRYYTCMKKDLSVPVLRRIIRNDWSDFIESTVDLFIYMIGVPLIFIVNLLKLVLHVPFLPFLWVYYSVFYKNSIDYYLRKEKQEPSDNDYAVSNGDNSKEPVWKQIIRGVSLTPVILFGLLIGYSLYMNIQEKGLMFLLEIGTVLLMCFIVVGSLILYDNLSKKGGE